MKKARIQVLLQCRQRVIQKINQDECFDLEYKVSEHSKSIHMMITLQRRHNFYFIGIIEPFQDSHNIEKSKKE